MAREVIMEITSSASAVQAVLEKSSSQLATLGILDSLASTILQFCWALLGIAALYRFSSTLAGYAAVALGRLLDVPRILVSSNLTCGKDSSS